MKHAFLLTILSLGITAFAQASTTTEIVEVPIQHAYTPSVGFDNNDTVQIVIEGILPNGCYSIAYELPSFSPEKMIRVKQYAFRRHDELCGMKDDQVASRLQAPVPFFSVLEVGRLKAGQYHVWFAGEGASRKTIPLRVDVTPTASIDSSPYASVTNAFVVEGIAADQPFEARLTGILTSGCMRLEEPEVKVLDNVVLVLPKLTVRPLALCPDQRKPFELVAKVGGLKPGRYLLHVRSMDGRAVNQTFSVQ